jgi:uncharacterized protein (TIGR02246 family)
MMQRWSFAWVLLLVASAIQAQDKKAEGDPKEDPAHAELRALKSELEAAFNKKDIDGILKHLHPDVVVTWQNGEVSKGPQQVRKYYERMLVGDDAVLREVKASPEVTDLSLLFGTPATTAVAYGKLNDHYTMRDGKHIAMDSRFSATAIKHEGRWLIVSFHGSTNVFDNAVLDQYKRMMWWGGGGVAAAALLLGLIFGRLMTPRKAAP